MEKPRKIQVWSLSTLLSAAMSLICMGSMGAMGIAASAGAAVAGSMAGMNGAVVTSGPSHVALTTQFLQRIGMDALTHIPDTTLRPIFIVLLLVGVLGSYIAYRNHRSFAPMLIVVGASILLYTGIYVIPSDALYYLSLMLLLLGSAWNVLARSAPTPTNYRNGSSFANSRLSRR